MKSGYLNVAFGITDITTEEETLRQEPLDESRYVYRLEVDGIEFIAISSENPCLFKQTSLRKFGVARVGNVEVTKMRVIK